MSLSNTVELYTNKCYVEVDDSNSDFYENGDNANANEYNKALQSAFMEYYKKEGNVAIYDYTYGIGEDLPNSISIISDKDDGDDNDDLCPRNGDNEQVTVVPNDLKYIVLSYIVYSTKTEKPRVITVSYQISIDQNDEIPATTTPEEDYLYYSCKFNITSIDMFIYERGKLNLIDSVKCNINTDNIIETRYIKYEDIYEFDGYKLQINGYYFILYDNGFIIDDNYIIFFYPKQWYDYIPSYKDNAKLRSYFYVVISQQ